VAPPSQHAHRGAAVAPIARVREFYRIARRRWEFVRERPAHKRKVSAFFSHFSQITEHTDTVCGTSNSRSPRTSPTYGGFWQIESDFYIAGLPPQTLIIGGTYLHSYRFRTVPFSSTLSR
jgi:hypothetical protein